MSKVVTEAEKIAKKAEAKMKKILAEKHFMCTLCANIHQIKEEDLATVVLVAGKGETMELKIYQCPECLEMNVPEALNPIAFIVEPA